MTAQEIQLDIDALRAVLKDAKVTTLTSSDVQALATWELALQHAIRNELLRESNDMSRQSLENWKQDSEERKGRIG